jgi:hypothetical protein
MLSHLRIELLRLVRARPLASVAVGRCRYSVGYSVASAGPFDHVGLTNPRIFRIMVHVGPGASGERRRAGQPIAPCERQAIIDEGKQP